MKDFANHEKQYWINAFAYDSFVEDFKMGLITKEQLRYVCFHFNMNAHSLSKLHELGVITKDELYTHLFPSSYVSEKKGKNIKRKKRNEKKFDIKFGIGRRLVCCLRKSRKLC